MHALTIKGRKGNEEVLLLNYNLKNKNIQAQSLF